MKLTYYALWYLKCRLLGKRIPLESEVYITTRCNLNCRHCFIRGAIASGSLKEVELKYEEILRVLKYCYNAGSRIVWFEGGEPLLWRDEDYSLEDLVQEAKRTGFFAVTFTTNGTLPIKSGADLIWVSIDGTREIHDQIRGKGSFDWLIENVEGSSHPRIYANMIINPLNYRVVEDVVKMVAQSKGFRAISMSFHTPHPGVEDLFLPWEKRKEVLDKVIELKKHGFPIINSFAGLNLHYSNKWKRRCWMNNFAFPDGEIHSECWGSRDGICDRCGYGMGAEMSALFDLKPSTIGAALRLFSGRI